MTKQIAFLLIIALRVLYNPGSEDSSLSAFANPDPKVSPSITVLPGEQFQRTGSSERLILKWMIGDNRPGTCFQPVKEFYDFDSNEQHSFGVKVISEGFVIVSRTQKKSIT